MSCDRRLGADRRWLASGGGLLRHRTALDQSRGIDFSYLSVGTGPLALCIHGYPDSAWTWRHLLPDLADAGFRAVAPFNRGYAPTSLAPDGRYQAGVLGVDANALHAALGGDWTRC
ncbi:MAG: alpha/beta fold hydrolase [Microthrixaceae bacterium]